MIYYYQHTLLAMIQSYNLLRDFISKKKKKTKVIGSK